MSRNPMPKFKFVGKDSTGKVITPYADSVGEVYIHLSKNNLKGYITCEEPKL